MPRNIRNEAVSQLAEKLAARRQVTKTDAVRMAPENELRRLDEAVPLCERVRSLQDRVLSRPTTGVATPDVCRCIRVCRDPSNRHPIGCALGLTPTISSGPGFFLEPAQGPEGGAGGNAPSIHCPRLEA